MLEVGIQITILVPNVDGKSARTSAAFLGASAQNQIGSRAARGLPSQLGHNTGQLFSFIHTYREFRYS